MNMLSDVAARFDEWASANEAEAEEILAHLDSFPEEKRAYRQRLADWIMAEAVEFRARSHDLRYVEWCHSRD